MRLRHILILLVSLPLIGLAQKNIPGYMGKKWSIQYQLFLWPSFNNPNSEEVTVKPDAYDEYTDVKTSINLQNHIVASYTVSKRIDVIFDFNFSKTNFDLYSDVYTLDQSTLTYPEIKAKGGAAGIRIYTKHFAPLGSFLSFKLGYTKLEIEGLSYSTNEYSYVPNTDFTIEGGTKHAPTATMGFGTNRIISNRFIINYGVDFTFFAGGLFNWKTIRNEFSGDYLDLESGNTSYNQEIYLKKAAARYAMMCMVNLKIGVGILL